MATRIFQTKDERKNKLVDDLREIAVDTWHLMSNGYNSGLSISEETITEIILLELKLRHPKNVFIKQVSKRKEGKIGADWLWAFVGKNNSVFGMCVQAKRLFPDLTYRNIIEDKNKPAKQADKLIKEGSKFTDFTGKKLYPLYVFYNTWDEGATNKAESINKKCCERDLSHEAFGCSYADAYDVREVVKTHSTYLDDYIGISHPWSCLIACTVDEYQQDLAEALCERFVFKNLFDEEKEGIEMNSADYLTNLDEAYFIKSIMFNEVNEQMLLEMGVRGAVVIKQD